VDIRKTSLSGQTQVKPTAIDWNDQGFLLNYSPQVTADYAQSSARACFSRKKLFSENAATASGAVFRENLDSYGNVILRSVEIVAYQNQRKRAGGVILLGWKREIVWRL
jgi:hypothetical protein